MQKINKKVLRKNPSKLNVTLIDNSIINDIRLSGNAFKLLVTILSDTDEDYFSPNKYMNTSGIKGNTYYNMINELVELGYVKIESKGKNSNFYIISEFCDLKESVNKITNNYLNYHNIKYTEEDLNNAIKVENYELAALIHKVLNESVEDRVNAVIQSMKARKKAILKDKKKEDEGDDLPF